MGYLLDEAKDCIKQIKHFYDHAGFTGYDRAFPYAIELSELYSRAVGREDNDTLVVKSLMVKAEPLMEDMKKRKEEQKNQSEPPLTSRTS